MLVKRTVLLLQSGSLSCCPKQDVVEARNFMGPEEEEDEDGLWRWWRCVCCPLPAIPKLLWCLARRLPGGVVLLDESSISRGPDDLAGGDRHSVELTEDRN